MNADVPISPVRTSSNAIALSSAGIGLVTAVFYSNVGFEHAKSAYEAATGGSAGLSDYVTVGTAFWDGLPIAAAVAVIAGMLAAGHQVSAAMLRYGAGIVGLIALAIGASVDPAAHLVAYQATVSSGAKDTAGLFSVWLSVYGGLAAVLAAIAGVGVGYAVGVKATGRP